MAEDQSHEHDDRERARRVETTTEQSGAGLEGFTEQSEAPEYPMNLMANPRMGGRGNGPVRAEVMRQAQSTYGNRAVQRLVRHRFGAAAKDAAVSAGEEGMAVQEPVQRSADPNLASPEVASLPVRGPSIQRTTTHTIVIQRSLTGSFPVKAGGFEMGMETKEGAVTGAGPSGLQGTIKFLPTKDTPYANKIGLVQIVKLTDAGGANVNPVSLPTATGPQVRTAEDKAKGVEGGFFTDVLHNDPFITKKAKSAGDALSSYYPFSSKGGQVFGFKRSDDAADMKAAELFDFPGTTSTASNLDFSFETAAKADDSGAVFGAVKWSFGLRAGKVVNEHMDVNEGASATWEAALQKHQDFYVHEPVTFYFDFDKDTLNGTEEGKIDEFIDYLKRFPDVRLDLAGFADQKGDAGYNRALASRRAEAVAQALLRKGVDANRINPPTAKGETTEFTSDATNDQDRDANRRGNRRVMLTFVHTATPAPTGGGTP